MRILILATIVSLAAADVSHIVGKSEKDAQIRSQEQDVSPDGSYSWSYDTDNGISANEVASVRVLSEDVVAKVAQGSASWTAPDGQKIEFEYVADENGYRAQGEHIPTAPPIPPGILRALQYLQDNPPAPEVQN